MIINIYGGPGAGKSTVAAALFAKMNVSDVFIVPELVTEYAKELTWEDRNITLENQLYVTAKQYRNLWRVAKNGSVTHVITDSPILQGMMYAKLYHPEFPPCFYETFDYFDRKLGPATHVLLDRNTKYVRVGRNQSQEEAENFDARMFRLLSESGRKFYTFKTDEAVDGIYNLVMKGNNANVLTYDPHKSRLLYPSDGL